MAGFNIFLQTTLPILLLISMGFISKKFNILKIKDERVLNSYLFYFALPALLIVNLSEIVFTKEVYRFIIIGTLPILIILIICFLYYVIFKISKKTLYITIISTISSNTVFYGIPFITFAFNTKESEYLATLLASSVSIIVTIVSILILELYKVENETIIKDQNLRELDGPIIVIKRLSKNPLIVSVIIGCTISIIGFKIPLPIYNPLSMMGGTTTTMALFSLGLFIYGRKFTNIIESLKYSILKITVLPVLSMIVLKLFNLPNIQSYVIVLMNSMPLALSMTILSEQYDFYKETIASTILITSITAGIYLNLILIIIEKIF